MLHRQGRLTPEEIDRLVELHHTEQEQVRLVLLPTVVTNRRGRIVTDLEAGDFRLFEDSVPREIGGPRGPEPTRYGDWERAGRCIDF